MIAEVVGTSNKEAGELHLYLPKELDPERLPKRIRDECVLLCSLLHWKWLNWKAKPGGWVHLKYEYLKKLINDRRLKLVISTLMSKGIVERDERYRAGYYSKAYRLSPAFRPCRVVRIRNKSLSRRLAAAERPKLAHYRYLEQELKNQEIDMAAAECVIATLVPDEGCSMPLAEYRQLALKLCGTFKQRHLPLTCDPYSRCHSPLHGSHAS